MIIFASGRCDIPAFYSTWFYQRLKAGYVDVRNPYNPHQISRIQLNEQQVDVLVFCTKNPQPILDRMHEIPFPFLFHITITPYREDIEHVHNKKAILSSITTLASILGKDRVIVRYDPIFLNDHYTIEYHARAFAKLCDEIKGYVSTIIISFVDIYKNTRQNISKMHLQSMTKTDMQEIGKRFGRIAQAHAMHVQTCAEEVDLQVYGIQNKPCFDRAQLATIAGHSLSHIKNKGVRQNCKCIATVDIGDYNCCPHQCLYCYANYNAKTIQGRMKQHDPNSSVLIGHIQEGDTIIERKDTVHKQTSLF